MVKDKRSLAEFQKPRKAIAFALKKFGSNAGRGAPLADVGRRAKENYKDLLGRDYMAFVIEAEDFFREQGKRPPRQPDKLLEAYFKTPQGKRLLKWR